MKKWFESWFDTKYYHILYNKRNFTEAEEFIDRLLQKLNLKRDAKVLDLACGKGRHSFYLNRKGFEVTGVDLSQNSINRAKELENDNLHFLVHDMRDNCEQKYDAVLNLFTSFGYFDEPGQDQQIICNIREALNDDNSIAVIDYINAQKAIENLENQTQEIRGKLIFNIKKWFDENSINKEISFTDQGEEFVFTEKIKRFSLNDFKQLFANCNLHLIATFGSYKMDPYDEKTSDRLILIFKK